MNERWVPEGDGFHGVKLVEIDADELDALRAKCAQLEAAYKNELLRRTRVEEKITALIDAFTDLGMNVRMDDE